MGAKFALTAASGGTLSLGAGGITLADRAVTFRKSGPKQLTINGTNTTTSALIAFAGMLTRSNSFANPTKTVLTMTTSVADWFGTECGTSREPELVLDAGVNAVFKEVILNGRHLASGTWGGTDLSAQRKDGAHFSGSGMITVLGGGMMIIFR